MIIVYIGGGLANKMFQYALSLAIRKKGFDVKYDLHTFKSEFSHDKVSLTEIFPNAILDKIILTKNIAAGRNEKLFRLYKKLSPYYIIETGYKFNRNFYLQLKDNCYIEGAWQDERYFKEISEEVHNAFKFPILEDKRNKEIVEEMSLTNSVAIHIRKSDGYGTWNIFNNTCPKEYYANAIKYIENHVNNPRFFVFTDNPGIISKYLNIEDYTLIDWNPTIGIKNYLDMQLMSCARHNIIANSTYSWWGAWLNKNPNKIVIAPNNWFNPKSKLSKINHIIPSEWIKL